MNRISSLFNQPDLNLQRLQEMEAMPEPRSRYLIAITPRSGSTYLCDIMHKTKRFGTPYEIMNEIGIPKIMKHIPGRTPEEYLRYALRAKKTPNGVSGTKASWFQFQNFIDAMQDRSYLSGFKYIYLTRRNLAAQAVSLYKATASSVFHSNIQHSEEAIKKLEALEYDYAQIKYWYDHIRVQEKGWQQYFYENGIFPLYITYEDINEDALGVMRRIAAYIKVKPENVLMPKQSWHNKIADERNAEWARRFAWELSLQEGELLSNGLDHKQNYQVRLRNLCQRIKNFW